MSTTRPSHHQRVGESEPEYWKRRVEDLQTTLTGVSRRLDAETARADKAESALRSMAIERQRLIERAARAEAALASMGGQK